MQNYFLSLKNDAAYEESVTSLQKIIRLTESSLKSCKTFTFFKTIFSQCRAASRFEPMIAGKSTGELYHHATAAWSMTPYLVFCIAKHYSSILKCV
jgi:hypothetical protein